MSSTILAIVALSTLLPLVHCTGIVWLRVSSSQPISTRIEIVDRANTSRYGISFDLQLSPNIPKEYVVPMPSSPSHSPIPIFDYSIQMMSPLAGLRIGDKMGHRLTLLVNAPWINTTISQKDITVSASVRFECLPQFYGSKCQFYCPAGSKCEIGESPKRKCENNSENRFDGSKSICICKPGFHGEFCEQKDQQASSYTLFRSQDVIIVFFILLLISVSAVLLVAIARITQSSDPQREISEPEVIDSVYEGSYVASPFHHQYIV